MLKTLMNVNCNLATNPDYADTCLEISLQGLLNKRRQAFSTKDLTAAACSVNISLQQLWTHSTQQVMQNNANTGKR